MKFKKEYTLPIKIEDSTGFICGLPVSHKILVAMLPELVLNDGDTDLPLPLQISFEISSMYDEVEYIDLKVFCEPVEIGVRDTIIKQIGLESLEEDCRKCAYNFEAGMHGGQYAYNQ